MAKLYHAPVTRHSRYGPLGTKARYRLEMQARRGFLPRCIV
jgi:hypothetical protein